MHETLTVVNHGAATFVDKTCTLKFTGPFTGTKTVACGGVTKFVTFSVASGATYKHFYKSFITIPTNAPKGTYHFTTILGGTVNGAPFTSMTGTFSITVT